MSKKNKKNKKKINKPDVVYYPILDVYGFRGKADIKYCDVPNICFSLTDENDDREDEFIKQRIERGFDDSETWSLRDTIANFIIPRLERYIEIAPKTIVVEQMEEIKSFLEAMKLVARENGALILTDKEKQILEDGLQNFHKIFLGLWW